MNKQQFAKVLERDGSCVHCGSTDETLVVNHRANRGMGGSKARDVPSNWVVLCSSANQRLESDWRFANLGRKYGWKLSVYRDPRTTPVFHAGLGEWRVYDDDFGFIVLYGYAVE